jgi:hypothetical protein
MAKKDPASKRRPKTPQDYLARLPQFEPRPTPFADLQEYDVRVLLEQRNVKVLFDEQRNVKGLRDEQGNDVPYGKRRIDDVLSTFMAAYIRDATKRQPFLNDAKRAIAGYVGARETEYDRRKAKELLSDTSIALESTKRKLKEIAWWPELSNYLKYAFRGATGSWTRPASRQHERLEPFVFTPTERPEPSSQKQVKQELQRIDDLDRSYSDLAPDQIALRLSQLETVVSLAAERVTFGPGGDARRDQIAQDFTDQLASAWHQATETLPTCSRPTKRLKNASPFACLLRVINQELLEERHRSRNDFFEYGAKAVKRLRHDAKTGPVIGEGVETTLSAEEQRRETIAERRRRWRAEDRKWNWWETQLRKRTFAQMVVDGVIIPSGEYRPHRVTGEPEPVYIPNPKFAEKK